MEEIIAYKGFDKNLDGSISCRGFVYEPGKTYTMPELEIKPCKAGFHACRELWQCWNFYPNRANTVFYRVKCSGKIIELSEKLVCSEITVLDEVKLNNPLHFDAIRNIDDGVLVARLYNDNTMYYQEILMDLEAKPLFDRWYNRIYPAGEGLYRVGLDSKMNYADIRGKMLLKRWADHCETFHCGLAHFERKGRLHIIAADGRCWSRKWWKGIRIYEPGVAMALDSAGRWHLLDKNFRKTGPAFDDISMFNEDGGVWTAFIRDCKTGLSTYITSDGRLLTKEWYRWCFTFKNGTAFVETPHGMMLIRLDGTLVTNDVFQSAEVYCSVGDLRIVYMQDGGANLIRPDGTYVSETTFSLEGIICGKALMQKEGKYYVFGPEGLEFESESYKEAEDHICLG